MIKVHQHALINQMLYQKKLKLRPNDVLVRPTEKVSRTWNESRALGGQCMRIYIYIYIYMRACMCIYARTHTYIHTYIYIYIYIYIFLSLAPYCIKNAYQF